MAAPMPNYFQEAVSRVLGSWTALQLAVQQGFGGADSQAKAEWLIEAVDQWFQENDDIYPDELDEFLTEILDNEFETVVDDGSMQQVSKEICGCFRLYKSGKHEEIASRLSKLQPANVQNCVHKPSNEDSSSEEEMEQMDCEGASAKGSTSQSEQPSVTESGGEKTEEVEMAEEDDGWTVIKTTKKKKH